MLTRMLQYLKVAGGQLTVTDFIGSHGLMEFSVYSIPYYVNEVSVN